MAGVTLLAGTVAQSTAMAAVGALGGYFLLSMLSLLPVVKDYTPSALVDQGLLLLVGKSMASELLWPLVATLGLSAALVALAVALFRKQEL